LQNLMTKVPYLKKYFYNDILLEHHKQVKHTKK